MANTDATLVHEKRRAVLVCNGGDAGARLALSRNKVPVMLMMLALAGKQLTPVANADAVNETRVLLMMLALAGKQRMPVANADAALVHEKRESSNADDAGAGLVLS